mmetsp:Transcript_96945/g.271338  ORF Transcript_96945/g.271338 Transcript_96945/m.271338 type:complete len:249 (-) Transcript_96945:435-1181(-)
MSSVRTKRLMKAAASTRRWASESQTKSMTGSYSLSASISRAAIEDTQRTAAAPTAGSTSWQRARIFGFECSIKAATICAGTFGSSRNKSCRTANTALRTLGSRSPMPKWRYRVHCCSKKVAASTPAQRRIASKQLRRISGSTSFARRLSKATPKASRAADKLETARAASSRSATSVERRSLAPCASASRIWTSAVSHNSCSAWQAEPRPSTMFSAATVATWRRLRNWHSDSASVQSRSICNKPSSNMR